MTPGVILSLLPGIGLLDRAFELAGFCVVRVAMEVRSATFSVKAYGETFRVDFLRGKVRGYSCGQTRIEYENQKAE